MDIKQTIALARQKLNIEELTPMQKKMADLPLSASSVTLIAPTGSGKTLAFALPLLRRVKGGRQRTEAVVIAPSRELALQITRIISAISAPLRVACLYGGHSMTDETRSLQASVPDIVVGTPGRLLDHLKRGNLDLRRVDVVTIDEYDKALELGFADEMSRLIRVMRSAHLLILTSATTIAELPAYIKADANTVIDFTAEHLKPQLNHYNVASPGPDKLDTLNELLARLPKERTIIFVNHRESAQRVADYLLGKGFPATLYHGALDQQQRETAVDLFSCGATPIMVATDLAARGLDIPQVGSVIHYHLPDKEETRTHRNGRAARMGATGNVYTIVSPAETAPEGAPFDLTSATASPWPEKFDVLYFHEGKKEKLSKGDIVGALTQTAGIPSSDIGTIALHDHRALVPITPVNTQSALKTLNAAKIKNRRIRVTKLE